MYSVHKKRKTQDAGSNIYENRNETAGKAIVAFKFRSDQRQEKWEYDLQQQRKFQIWQTFLQK